MLFDTGYTRRFYTATAKFPAKLYAALTPVSIREEEEVSNQLAPFGLAPADIRHVILSHFHADHVGGLKDFPGARIHCSRAAYLQVKKLSPRWSFRKGILKSLLPDDLEERICFIEETPAVDHPILGVQYDLFGDGSLLACPLPGHAAGQVGLRLRTARRPYFLVADACWLIQSVTEERLPAGIVRLFFNSWTDFKKSLHRLQQFHRIHPEELIVPTHCAQTTNPLIARNEKPYAL
jgi:glyoxylase-like metal-dependent hydrolase (beta-lactamase superfamily II)